MRNFGEQIRCIVGNVQVAYNLKCKGYVCANWNLGIKMGQGEYGFLAIWVG